MATHIEVTNRAQFYFRPLGEHQLEYEKLTADADHQAYLEAGSYFPDWGYTCANQEDAAEAAHWPPFWNESIRYLQETYERPWNADARALVSFLLGVVSHGVADAPWHSLDMDKGFIEAIQHLHYCGDFSDAHTVSDAGGEFVLAHSSSLDYLSRTWKVPTGDLVNIYERLNITVTAYDINKCMLLGYTGAQSVRLIGRLLYPLFSTQAPYLAENYYDYFRGGLNDMAGWVTTCWHDTLEWFLYGPQVAPMCKSMDRDHVRPKRPVHEPDNDGGVPFPGIPEPDEDEDEEEDRTARLRKLVRKVSGHSFAKRVARDVKSDRGFDMLGIKAELVEDGEHATISMTKSVSLAMRLKTMDAWASSLASFYFANGSTEDPEPQPEDAMPDDHEPEPSKLPSNKRYPKLSKFLQSFLSLLSEMIFDMAERIEAVLNPWSINKCKGANNINPRTIDISIDYADLGAALAHGDFDGDGIQDLVIGAPGYTIPDSPVPQIGAVFILPGDIWRKASFPIQLEPLPPGVIRIHGDPLEVASRFGSAVAVLDVNDDGVDDLVVSAPRYNSVELFYDGRVYVFLGVRGKGLQPHDGNTADVEGVVNVFNAEDGASISIHAPQRNPDHTPGDRYSFLFTGLGATLATGDFDGDGRPDLIIASPDADVGSVARRGLLHGFTASHFLRLLPRAGAPGTVVNVSDASWATDSGEVLEHEMFGSSVTVVPGDRAREVDPTLIVGAPGWREPNGRASGRIYGFFLPPGSIRPMLRFTITGSHELDALGSKIALLGTFANWSNAVAVASPYEVQCVHKLGDI
ncbi:Glycosylphosphatidylinositol specific phospholipase D1 [Irineochytrium annulatum]|nr:Glycosylphosphatidylinositol specific phospholipase D1 [Irineochytrium annulatum]